MEKLLKFLKNKWFLLGISFLSFIYVYFLGKIVLRAFDSYLETENFSAMMVMYVFVNFIFGVLMFFTRKQIPTVICALIIPIEALLLMIVSFGQWYIIIPPVAVGAVIFLSCGVGESCKTVMGTLLLIMFVAGGLAYSVMSSYFGISLRFVATDILPNIESQDIDFSTRSNDYLVTEDGKYRLVRYIEQKADRVVTSYYVEEAFKDVEYPYAVFRRTFGSRSVLVTAYERNVNPKWISNDKLSIDGKILTIEEIFAPLTDDESEETTAAETKIPSRTTAPEITEATEISEDQTEEETEAAE